MVGSAATARIGSTQAPALTSALCASSSKIGRQADGAPVRSTSAATDESPASKPKRTIRHFECAW